MSRTPDPSGTGTGVRLLRGAAESPLTQAALLAAAAAELELRVHGELGRFGAAVVERAMLATSAEAAASQVADAFLDLCRPVLKPDIIVA